MLPAIRKRSAFPSLIDEFFGRELPGFFFDPERYLGTPAVNIIEGKDDYRIEVAAPGLEKNDFKISIDNNLLTISSEKELSNEEKGEQFMRKEFSYASFSRSFTVPDGTDQDKIQARHKDGILHVIIPKRDETKEKPARQVKIS